MKSLILPFLAIIVLFSCNDTPDLQPATQLISIYPNPVSDVATISVPNSGHQLVSIRIFDTKGKSIYELSPNYSVDQIYTFPMIDRPTGTYVVIFSTGSMVITEKLIKI